MRTDLRIAKQSSCFACVAEQRARTFRFGDKSWLNTEMTAKLKRQLANGKRFRPSNIQYERRSLTEGEGPQATGIRFALPMTLTLGIARSMERCSNTASPMSTRTP